MQATATDDLRDERIPDKLYFRIGDVSKLAGVKPYVLRYWESEFSAIAPKKTDSGHRLYRRKDVELILEIKSLLYEKRFTLEGARKALGSQRKATSAASEDPQPVRSETPAPDIRSIRQELQAILELLK